MTTYSCAIQPIFSARVNKLPHTDSRVITECNIMYYSKSCRFLHCTVFEYDKIRTQFLMKYASSTISVHYGGLHMHEGCFMLGL